MPNMMNIDDQHAHLCVQLNEPENDEGHTGKVRRNGGGRGVSPVMVSPLVKFVRGEPRQIEERMRNRGGRPVGGTGDGGGGRRGGEGGSLQEAKMLTFLVDPEPWCDEVRVRGATICRSITSCRASITEFFCELGLCMCTHRYTCL
jgi:hypothetical protein